jgi:hypothetical protein
MKTSRIAALALIATAAVGFNAYAETTSDNFFAPAQKTVSTLTRAQVQAEAVQARDNFQRGYSVERGDYLISAPVQATGSTLTREAVRAEAIKSRGTFVVQDNAG